MKKLATMFISMILVLSLLCACGLTDKLNGTDTDGKKYQKYVKGLMDGSYKGDTNAYMSVCDADKTAAQKNYDDCMLYYVRSILYTFGFDDYTVLPTEVVDKYTEFTKKAVNEVKYTVDKGTKKDKKWYVTIHVSPMNIFTDKVVEEVKDYYTKFGEEYTEEKIADFSEDDYNEMVSTYLEALLDILKDNFDDREYEEEVEKDIEIVIDGKTYGVEEEKWYEIDNLVMALGEADESSDAEESDN
ncbi:MAG: hypothetical protein IJM14_04245 [Lachnospiraceae bacterium]|nr:hypothetical protein [Lachnospiraceae bacterium]